MSTLRKITQAQHDEIKVINALMWLQNFVYAVDEVENVKWFNSKQTKMHIKKTLDVVLKQHGHQINEMWRTPGEVLPEMTKQLSDFTYEMTTFGYWMLPELTEFIREKKQTLERVEIIK